MNIEQLAIKNLEAQIEIYRKVVGNYQQLLNHIQAECYNVHKGIIAGEMQSEVLESMGSDIFRATSATRECTKNITDGFEWLKQLQP